MAIKPKTTKKTSKRGLESLADQLPPATPQDEIRQLLLHLKSIKPKGENQTSLLKAIKDPACAVVIAAGMAGTGKAQPLDTPILTPDGWSTMGELQVGSYVISADGTPTKVLAIFPQGEKEIYRVTFNDGTSTECCKEHLWMTQTARDRYARDKKNNVKQPRNGSVKTLEEISKCLVYHKHANHSIPTTKPVVFSEKNLPIDPYLLGALLGDGGLTNTVQFTSADQSIIDLAAKNLPANHSFNKRTKSGNPYNYALTSPRGQENEILTVLRNLGLMGKGSPEKFIPQEYLLSSIEQRIALLRGLMDTDGHVGESGIDVEFYTSSKQLEKDMRFLVESLGSIVVTTLKEKTPYTHKGEKLMGLPCYRMRIRCNPEINPFALARKAERFRPPTKYKPTRFIKNVELVGNKLAQCILIEHPSHLYLTNNCIVTHNTFITLAGALQLLKDPNSGYDTIMLSKSVQLLEHEDFGFLPGSVEDKLALTHQSFFWHLNRLLGDDKLLTTLRDKGAIQILPVGVLRGLSIPPGTIVILDEAQNLSVANIHTLLTRMEDGAKLVCLGDIYQRDRGNQRDSGLLYLLNHIKGIDDAVRTVEFTPADAVRSRLTAAFQAAYEGFLGAERPSQLRRLRGEPEPPKEPLQVQLTPQILVEGNPNILAHSITETLSSASTFKRSL